MEEERAARDLDALTAEPDQLDGHTIDELADYLDRGRTPVDDSIEASPACRHALAALERLRSIAPDLLVDDVEEPPDDEGWIRALLGTISADAHAGADFTVHRTDDGDEGVMTEGALRALVRAAGDARPGVLVGRVRLAGDLAGAGGDPVTIAVDVVVAHGLPIQDEVPVLRAAIRAQVERHTAIRRPRIDVTVRDLLLGAR